MKKSVFFTMAAVAAGTIMPTLLLSSCGKAEEKAAATSEADELPRIDGSTSAKRVHRNCRSREHQ